MSSSSIEFHKIWIEQCQATEGKGRADAKACTDELLAGRSVALSFSSAGRAGEFCAEVQALGVLARREKRYR